MNVGWNRANGKIIVITAAWEAAKYSCCWKMNQSTKKCWKFQQMTKQEWWDVAKDKQLWLRCLRIGDKSKNVQSQLSVQGMVTLISTTFCFTQILGKLILSDKPILQWLLQWTRPTPQPTQMGYSNAAIIHGTDGPPIYYVGREERPMETAVWRFTSLDGGVTCNMITKSLTVNLDWMRTSGKFPVHRDKRRKFISWMSSEVEIWSSICWCRFQIPLLLWSYASGHHPLQPILEEAVKQWLYPKQLQGKSVRSVVRQWITGKYNATVYPRKILAGNGG